VFSEGDWVAFIPYVLLIAVVAVTGFVQQRQIQGRVPKGQVNSQQQMIMKFLPIMLPIFSFTLPGGLVLYFAVSNLYRVGQQWFISRKIYGLQRGETVDLKRLREGDDESTDKKAAAVVTTATVVDGKKPAKSAKSASGGSASTPAKARQKGADGTRGQAGSSRSKSSKGQGRTTQRSSAGGSPTPSVQPRGRKKKR